MSIFSSKGKEKLMLVFDIGSSSVGGAIFYMQASGIPKIIYSVRELIGSQEKIDAKLLLDYTIKALEVVVDKIATEHLGSPVGIFCVLASPWYASQTRTISMKKNEPFVFTAKLADELIQKEINLFEEEYAKKYPEMSNAFKPIELKNTKIMLNGYETSKPFNQKAEELEMTIFISMSPEYVLGRVTQAISKHFHPQSIKFASFIMTSFAVVRDMFAEQANFLLLDIGGEITDISMIKKNILRESISFPLGRNFITRGVAEILSCSLDEARSIISLYKDGHATVEVTNKIEPIMNKLREEWLAKFQESLANLSNDVSIPATVFVAVYKDLADIFSETIKREQFNQYTLTESKFEVKFLDIKMLHGAAVFADNAVRDPFIIMDAIYINNFVK